MRPELILELFASFDFSDAGSRSLIEQTRCNFHLSTDYWRQKHAGTRPRCTSGRTRLGTATAGMQLSPRVCFGLKTLDDLQMKGRFFQRSSEAKRRASSSFNMMHGLGTRGLRVRAPPGSSSASGGSDEHAFRQRSTPCTISPPHGTRRIPCFRRHPRKIYDSRCSPGHRKQPMRTESACCTLLMRGASARDHVYTYK